MENSKEWLAVYGGPNDSPGCFRSESKHGPCVAPCPTLSQRAEEVLGLFWESMSTAVGMGVGLAPSRVAAVELTRSCGTHATGEWWFLFGDLEKAWCKHMNEKKPEE